MEKMEQIFEVLPEMLGMEETVGLVSTLTKQWGISDAGEVLGYVSGLLGVREPGKGTADL